MKTFQLFQSFSELLFPLFIITIIIFCVFKKSDIIKAFKKGATDGFETCFEILPSILLILVSSSLLRETGALSFFTKLISPITSFLKIPPDLCDLILMRPVSGSGSIALLKNLYSLSGPDSTSGLIASVIAASTETTLYTVSIYFGVTKVKKTALPLITGIMADIFTVFFSIYIVNLFF